MGLLEVILCQSRAQNTTFGTKELKLNLGVIAVGVIWRDFMVSRHHNKAFIWLLFSSGQSQVHFGNKFNLVGACVAKLWLHFAGGSKKIILAQKNAKIYPQKGNVFAFKGHRKVLMASFCSHHEYTKIKWTSNIFCPGPISRHRWPMCAHIACLIIGVCKKS